MSKSFLTHFTMMISLHAVLFVGTWQLSQSEIVKNSLSKVGPGILKLQIASRMIMQSAPIEKKVSSSSKNSVKPAPKVMEEQKVQETPREPQEAIMGSAIGTSSTGTADVLTVYKAELRAKIDQNKYYPTMSRRLGQTGTVVVAFTLLKDGNIVNVRLDKPSQYERLNSSALDAVKKVERFRPLPKEVGGLSMDVKVPVKFVTI
jgi:protein TonB